MYFQVIYAVCQHCRIDKVIDVGSGQGHLSRLLSFGYGLNVTTVEAAGCHAPKATKYDRYDLEGSASWRVCDGQAQHAQEQLPIVSLNHSKTHVTNWSATLILEYMQVNQIRKFVCSNVSFIHIVQYNLITQYW